MNFNLRKPVPKRLTHRLTALKMGILAASFKECNGRLIFLAFFKPLIF